MCTACFLRTCTADKDNRKWPNSDRRGNYICTQVTNKLTPASWHEARNSCWGIHLRLLTAPVQVRIFYLSFIAGMSSTGDVQPSYYVSKQKLERSLSFCPASTWCRDNAKRQKNGWRNCFIVGQSSWTKLHLLIPARTCYTSCILFDLCTCQGIVELIWVDVDEFREFKCHVDILHTWKHFEKKKENSPTHRV